MATELLNVRIARNDIVSDARGGHMNKGGSWVDEFLMNVDPLVLTKFSLLGILKERGFDHRFAGRCLEPDGGPYEEGEPFMFHMDDRHGMSRFELHFTPFEGSAHERAAALRAVEMEII